MRRKVWMLVGILLCFIFMTQTWAQETVELEEIVVTATKTPKRIEDAPASITVITAEDLKKENVKTLDEALRHVSGIFLRRGKGLMDTLSAVTLRGFPEQKRTLILLDGQPLNNGYTGAVDWNSLPLENIDRIEVVKGPFSSLYGGNAMGGVINIITKTPKKREIRAKTGYGTYDTVMEGFYYGDNWKDKLFFSFGYEGKDTNGYVTDYYVKTKTSTGTGTPVTGAISTTDAYGNPGYILGDKGDNWIRTYNANTKWQWKFDKDSKLTFYFQEGFYKYGYDNGQSYLRDANGNVVDSGKVEIEGKVYSVSPYYFLGGYGERIADVYNLKFESAPFEKIKLHCQGGINDSRKNWYVLPQSGATTSGGAGKLASTPSREYQWEVQTDILHDDGVLTLGVAYRRERAHTREWKLSNWRDKTSKEEFTYTSFGKTRMASFYFQEELHLPYELTVYTGARYDHWKTWDGYFEDYTKGTSEHYTPRKQDAFSPKITFVWQPWKIVSFRLSGGSAFRAPTVYELYRTWYYYSYEYRGNPDLKPERTRSWEIGSNFRFFEGKTIFKVTYFENYVKDLIYRSETTSKVYEYTNAGKADIKGIELEAEQKVADWLKLFATYSNKLTMKIVENTAKPESVNKWITYTPKVTASAGIEANYKFLKGTLTWNYVGKVYKKDDNSDTAENVPGVFDSHHLVNLKLSANVTKYATISFAVDNLTDEDYYWSYKTPGRTYWGQIELKY
ncbi:MAG: TonB-dependent receptor [Candidatus Desulfofervidaceae bacterium]|nr:TonB-dependent receptor [Candidatus Desulfofervidaceae bacterium]